MPKDRLAQALRRIGERKRDITFSQNWKVANTPDHPEARLDELDRVIAILEDEDG